MVDAHAAPLRSTLNGVTAKHTNKSHGSSPHQQCVISAWSPRVEDVRKIEMHRQAALVMAKKLSPSPRGASVGSAHACEHTYGVTLPLLDLVLTPHHRAFDTRLKWHSCTRGLAQERLCPRMSRTSRLVKAWR